MASKQFDIADLIPKGSKVKGLSIETPEDAEDKAARLRREFWTFLVKDLAAYFVAFVFLIVVATYCCFVVARNGVVSAEARAVFPLLTTLFGGVVGLIIGKAGK